MMLELNHKKIRAWQLAIELVSEVYFQTSNFPKHEIYGLRSQIRRAAISIPSNIAEGSSRLSQIERRRFLEISRASLVELDTQIHIATKLGYLNCDNQTELDKLVNSIFALLTKMMNNNY